MKVAGGGPIHVRDSWGSGARVALIFHLRLAFYLFLLAASPLTGSALAGVAVQEITGHLGPDERLVYSLPHLKKNRTLYARAQGTSGNLDPLLVLIRPGTDLSALRESFVIELEKTIAAGGDPLVVIPEFAKRHELSWDDDGGPGYGAALRFPIHESGTYHLLVRSTFARETFGDFQLLLGLDSPEVLAGTARPTGARIAVPDPAAGSSDTSVQEVKLTISAERPETYFFLNPVKAGETLFVYLEGPPGEPLPAFTLHDYGDKPVRNSTAGEPGTAFLRYTFPADAKNYLLRFKGVAGDGTIRAGDYRLLVGINEPAILTGQVRPGGRPVLRQPIPVKIGLRLQQITGVDQKAENFGVVATLQMRWKDRALAFSPDSCHCPFEIFNEDEFTKFADSRNIAWPEFTLYNQQGNRWVQNRYVVVFPEGDAVYLERFSTTLQAPDFNFRRFPFDHQQFYILIDNLYPEEFFQFQSMEEFNQVGAALGEEEWVVVESDTSVTSDLSSSLRPVSRFNFGFEASRHLTYYVFRIFLPLLIIIAVSWIIFFSKDYAKRIDVAATNLLIFIAFNFTISGDLPRLGYLTFMDSIIVSGFLVTSLVLIFNVYIRRLELTGMISWVQKVDQYMLWIYPIFYLAAAAIVILLFN